MVTIRFDDGAAYERYMGKCNRLESAPPAEATSDGVQLRVIEP
jgi:hypothetical protein